MDADEAALRKEARRAKLKIAAKMRAQLAFQHNLERIDQRLDEIEPEQAKIEKMLDEGKTLELESGA